MTEHEHRCTLCSVYEPCDSPLCEIGPRVHHTSGAQTPVAEGGRPCSACEQSLDEVDALPNPERGPLALASIERVVARATRAAIAKGASSPEDAPATFADHVDPLAPRDSTRQDPDTWTRIGVVMGAKAAWSGSTTFALPPDCPAGAPARCYIGGWGFASGVVMQIRLEVGSHG
jgi:hypothetical protein